MAKKIEGYAQDNGDGTFKLWEVPFSEHTNRKATLIIHESSKHERVFTESEVMAIADGIKLAIVELGGYYDANAKWCPIHGVRVGSIEQVFKAHGISLDPA